MARIASHCETVLLDDLSSRNRSEHTTKNTRHMQRTNQERRGHNTRTSPHDRQRFRWKGKGSKGTLPEHAEDSRRLRSNQEETFGRSRLLRNPPEQPRRFHQANFQDRRGSRLCSGHWLPAVRSDRPELEGRQEIHQAARGTKRPCSLG